MEYSRVGMVGTVEIDAVMLDRLLSGTRVLCVGASGHGIELIQRGEDSSTRTVYESGALGIRGDDNTKLHTLTHYMSVTCQ